MLFRSLRLSERSFLSPQRSPSQAVHHHSPPTARYQWRLYPPVVSRRAPFPLTRDELTLSAQSQRSRQRRTRRKPATSSSRKVRPPLRPGSPALTLSETADSDSLGVLSPSSPRRPSARTNPSPPQRATRPFPSSRTPRSRLLSSVRSGRSRTQTTAGSSRPSGSASRVA